MSFSSKTTQRSQRRRRCECSSAWIEPGDAYVRLNGICDGDFYSVPVHPVAEAIYSRRNARCWAGGEGLMFEDLLEDILEATRDPFRDADHATLKELPGVPGWFAERFLSKPVPANQNKES